MHIIWKGHFCFQITALQKKGERILITTDPLLDGNGFKGSILKSDILLFTRFPEKIRVKKGIFGNAFVIRGPGEYEIKEIFAQGVYSLDDDLDDDLENNDSKGLVQPGVARASFYVIEAEGMRICHLGNMRQKELTEDQLDVFGNIDILMLPIDRVDSAGVAKIISQIEPRVVIPMGYQVSEKEKLSQFLKAVGETAVQPQDKLVLKKKDLPLEGMKIVVLNP